MVNQDLSNIGKTLAVVGFFTLMFGLSLLFANSGGFCAGPLQPPGFNGPGCTTDYTALVLPTIAGGALIATGAWLFWVFKPRSRTPWSPG